MKTWYLAQIHHAEARLKINPHDQQAQQDWQNYVALLRTVCGVVYQEQKKC